MAPSLEMGRLVGARLRSECSGHLSYVGGYLLAHRSASGPPDAPSTSTSSSPCQQQSESCHDRTPGPLES
jgi:hypothetical protein